jgi:hypothetical protein
LSFTFTNEAGVELDLDDGSDYEVRRWSGIGAPDLSVQTFQRYNRPGSVIRRASLPARQVMVSMWVKGTSEADCDGNMDALLSHLAGSYGRNEPRFGLLKYTRSDASVRSLRCIVAGGLGRDESQYITPVLRSIGVMFLADHPSWYDATEQSVDLTIGTTLDVVFPLDLPHTFGLDGQSAGVSLSYTGTAETRSLLWQVPGPSVAPALINVTTGESLKFSNLTVPEGLTLKVRMGWRPDGVRDIRAYLDDGLGGETSVMGYLDSGSRFVRLDPGTNVLEVAQTNEAATAHTLKHYREYLAA